MLKVALTVLHRVSALLFPYCPSNASDFVFVPVSLPGLTLTLPAAVSTASDVKLDGAMLSGSNVAGNSTGGVGSGSLPARAFLLPGTPGSAMAVWLLAAKDTDGTLHVVKVQVIVSNGTASISALASGTVSPAPQVNSMSPSYVEDTQVIAFCTHLSLPTYRIYGTGNTFNVLYIKVPLTPELHFIIGCLDTSQRRKGIEYSHISHGRPMHLLQRCRGEECRSFHCPRKWRQRVASGPWLLPTWCQKSPRGKYAQPEN